jgi:hypothetical protein
MSKSIVYTLDLGDLGEQDVIVEYSFFGKNRPATWDNPPEYVEVEIEHILFNGVDIYHYLSNNAEEYLKDYLLCMDTED